MKTIKVGNPKIRVTGDNQIEIDHVAVIELTTDRPWWMKPFRLKIRITTSLEEKEVWAHEGDTVNIAFTDTWEVRT